MNEQLIAAALSLEAKAEAIADTDAAIAANDNTSLILATIEGKRYSIYTEIAASLREAANFK